MATSTVSFRVDAALLSEIDSLARTSGKDRSAVLTDLVRTGLGVKRGQAADTTATTLAELVTEVRRLRARIKRTSATDELETLLEHVSERLAQVLIEQQGRALEIVTQDIATLRQHVRRSFGNTLRIAFKLTEEQAQEHVRRTFDT